MADLLDFRGSLSRAHAMDSPSMSTPYSSGGAGILSQKSSVRPEPQPKSNIVPL